MTNPAQTGRVIVLIPAYNPDSALTALVDRLHQSGLKDVIVVDDGSDSQHAGVFGEIAGKAHILRHAVNLGKGAALKTGFNHVCMEYPDADGVVTADADGQHAPDDIVRVASALRENRGMVVLGRREFTGRIPLRSLVGNILTRYLFLLMIGRRISDTQTGLRGLPLPLLPPLIALEGSGYEYEMSMLMALRQLRCGILEVGIATVYQPGNATSHFNPFFDSMRIYVTLFRFAISSLTASLIDLVVFYASYRLTSSLLLSMLLGRYTIGPFVNFSMNKNFVFHNTGGYLSALAKYFAFATVMGLLATALMSYATAHFGANVLVAKVVVETVLFFASFSIQRDFIFGNRGTTG